MLLAVLANRFDGVVREMSNTLLRAARSAVINSARDFSCGITTAGNEMFATAEGLPIHTAGLHLQTRAMTELHADLAEGDAYLHNDPYLGNTHPADHTILVPVFWEGEHLFNVCAKAHQADIGNSVPTTYHAAARDIYEEGALIFPCVRVQRNYESQDDIVRMCRRRIRVPDQWYGDFLAALGSARTGERRLHEVFQKYGTATIKQFVEEWFDYSEERMAHALSALPKATVTGESFHDPLPPMLPEGIPVRAHIEVDPKRERVTIDLRDNIDCMDNGLNLSEACAVVSAMTGLFNSLPPDIPRNAGSFRRVDVKLRENCAVGIPRFPHSCSVATTNVSDRLVNAVQSALAELGDGYGLAEGGVGMGAGISVISGTDPRYGDAPYVNQVILGNNGGPASPSCDGWLTYGVPVVAGLMYRDSVEVDELKYPIQVKELRVSKDVGGVGRTRGAPGLDLVYGPRGAAMTVVFAADGQRNPPRGVLGGGDGVAGENVHIDPDGRETLLPNVGQLKLEPGHWVRARDVAGAGYGDPLDRDPARVLEDVLEGYESESKAAEVYGVVFRGMRDDETLVVDEAATSKTRETRRAR
ncbi:MAG: hydantoinase B/oxoprolinase family protein [Myxococcales bacterium]|nr:hydantoinase B/oxoprolinase family protein [Myxococcales bacterium]